jgi:DNA mismatch repair protein MutS
MLQQYFRAKEEHPGVLLAMRVGDFYEFYGEDAEAAATALEITLTGREDAGNGRIPMAGVPFHSVEKYLARLVQQGHKVALCDQLEDPRTAKGLVKRGVTRVLTPGTVMEDSILSADNNFLAAIFVQDGKAGLATLDPSTGEFVVTEIDGERLQELVLQELARIRPSELLFAPEAEEYGAMARAGLGTATTETTAEPPARALRRLLDQFQTSSLESFGCADKRVAQVAASMILSYAEKNHLALHHVASISTYSVDGFMRLDPSTRRSLELTQNLADGGKKYTLLSVLDQTQTPMGLRLLKRWIDQPLLKREEILARQDSVERLINQGLVRGDLRDELRKLSDLERLVSRVASHLAGPRDLAALRNSLAVLPQLAEPLRKVGLGRIQELREMIGDHSELWLLLEKAIVTDPPHLLRDGGVIKEGHDLELDKLRSHSREAKQYVARLEAAERERTGIGNLKVGFNSVFGYFLEVPKSQMGKVPAEYIRKQTTANAERYITAELKEQESKVLGADEKAADLEIDLFTRLRARVGGHHQELLRTARALAEIDVLCSLAEVAVRNAYVKPEITEHDVMVVEGGRHPVVEAESPRFVPNDLSLAETRIVILTGPNMSGKSTYLRQNALIALMAQIGSFVPAKSCRLGICDRMFARIGAKDELALGQSTFMVEMIESANILNHATARSLVILDEVGRGTSTYDGLAIAWAMIEHIAAIGAKTMFATHYHQLNSLAEQVPSVANFRVSVEEVGEDIVWTHKVLPGGTDRSYGIHVARMAGVPPAVLLRAGEILRELEGSQPAPRAVMEQRLQLTLFESEQPEVVRALAAVDVNRMTPLEALSLLETWKQKFGK